MTRAEMPGEASGGAQTGTPTGKLSAADEWAWLARIRRPQGRKGEVFADILTDFPEKFAERRRLWLLQEPAASGVLYQGTTSVVPQTPQNKRRALAPETQLPAASPVASSSRAVELVAHWPHKGGMVLHFAGVDSISAAEALAGLIVAVPRTERAALGEDEAYIGDLIGCTLFDVAAGVGVAVGQIEDVDRTAGPVALLIVRGAAGEILIPFAKSYLRSIHLQARRRERW